MSKKDKIIITGKEKMAMFVMFFTKLSKFCVAIQFMNTLFRPEATPCLSIVIIYWIYCNWTESHFESDYINAMERLVYVKVVSRINREEYEEYVREHREYFELHNRE